MIPTPNQGTRRGAKRERSSAISMQTHTQKDINARNKCSKCTALCPGCCGHLHQQNKARLLPQSSFRFQQPLIQCVCKHEKVHTHCSHDECGSSFVSKSACMTHMQTCTWRAASKLSSAVGTFPSHRIRNLETIGQTNVVSTAPCNTRLQNVAAVGLSSSFVLSSSISSGLTAAAHQETSPPPSLRGHQGGLQGMTHDQAQLPQVNGLLAECGTCEEDHLLFPSAPSACSSFLAAGSSDSSVSSTSVNNMLGGAITPRWSQAQSSASVLEHIKAAFPITVACRLSPDGSGASGPTDDVCPKPAAQHPMPVSCIYHRLLVQILRIWEIVLGWAPRRALSLTALWLLTSRCGARCQRMPRQRVLFYAHRP